MPVWLYIVACVLVPACWGLLMYVGFNVLDRKRMAQRQADAPPPIDYSI